MLYSLFKLHIPVLRIQLAVLWGAFLVIQFIISVVMVLIRPEESILISGTLLPFAGAFSLFALTQRLVLVDFQDGVRMGRTRRQMLGLTLALIGADALLVSLSALLLPWLERTLCIRLWALLARRPGAAVMVEAPGRAASCGTPAMTPAGSGWRTSVRTPVARPADPAGRCAPGLSAGRSGPALRPPELFSPLHFVPVPHLCSTGGVAEGRPLAPPRRPSAGRRDGLVSLVSSPCPGPAIFIAL